MHFPGRVSSQGVSFNIRRISPLFSKNEDAINISKLLLTDSYSHSTFNYFLLQSHSLTLITSEEMERVGMLLCLLGQFGMFLRTEKKRGAWVALSLHKHF